VQDRADLTGPHRLLSFAIFPFSKIGDIVPLIVPIHSGQREASVAVDGTTAEGTKDLESYGYQQELKRSLTFTDLLVYGLIFMVPIAPFGIFGGVFQASGGMVALAYAIGMVAMMFTALSYSQMAKAFPMAGSVYTYAGRGIAQPVGFMAGWAILLDYILVPSLLYLIAGVAMNSFVTAIPVWAWIAGFVLLNTVINYFGIELTARVNRIMLAAELVVLAIFIVIGIVAVSQGKGRGFSWEPIFNSGTFSWSLIFGAASIAVLSFLGFDGISTLAEENRDSARQIGRAMVFGCSSRACCSSCRPGWRRCSWPTRPG
jgi:amino acid transporter